MRPTTGWVLVACLVGPVWPAEGQEPAVASAGEEGPAESPPPAGPPPPQAGAPPRPTPARDDPATEMDVGLGTRLAVGAGFSRPLGVAGRVRILHGLAADVREEDGRVRAVCAVPVDHCAQGFVVDAEAGAGGGKLSLGLGARARIDEEDFRATMGAGLRASLLRTWGTPFGAEPGLTYLGPELDLTAFHVRLDLGLLWRLAGDPGGRLLFTWGLGLEL